MIIPGKLPQVLGMEQLNVVIRHDHRAFDLAQGTPQELGIDNSQVYLTFIYSKTEVVVWTTLDLDKDARRTVSHLLLAFVRERMGDFADLSSDSSAANGA